MKHIISVYTGGKLHQKVALEDLPAFQEGRPVTVGRLEESDIFLPFPAVSRSHAHLELNEGYLEMVDDGSLNKLRVNDIPYERIRLIDGMKIVIGANESARGAVVLIYSVENKETKEPEKKRAVREKIDIEPAETNKSYVGRRILAMMVDFLIWAFMWIGCFVVCVFVGFFKTVILFTILLGLIVGWLYFALMESANQQSTIGKLMMGLAVVTEDGSPLTFRRASGRFFAKMLSSILLFIGYLPIFGKKRTLHDRLSGTKTILRKEMENF